jgi:septum formation protein
MDIILASTSPYRRRLLERLQLPFRCIAPLTDETALSGELPVALAQRLALAKAESVALQYPQALVIGSDQVAALDQKLLGKPGTFEVAAAQLRASSGREVLFHTGLSLICRTQNLQQQHVEPFAVRFRQLSDQQIRSYLEKEQPYDCAGSFKVEGLGIALFETLNGNDPTSLEGLPLMALSDMLRAAGVDVLADTRQ